MAEQRLLFSQYDPLLEMTARVWQQGSIRRLDFDDTVLQTEIELANPERLVSTLNHYLLAGCLFVEQPQRILLAGTGGGAIARYFAHHFNETIGDAVEISSVVCDIAKRFFEFPQTDNWQLHQQDIKQYIAGCDHVYDLIVVDIAEHQLTPEWLVESKLLHQMRMLLTAQGHIAINLLVKDGDTFMRMLATIRNVFDRVTVCASLPEYSNIVVYAYNKKPTILSEQVEERAAELQQCWKIPFVEIYQRMLKDNPKGSGVF
jgi:spermidine synthase